MPTTPIISLKNVTFQYQNQSEPTLKNIDLQIKPGEKVLLTGPSGSGKSTLGNLLNGVIPEEFPGELSGQLMINGKNLAELDLTALSFEVGTVLQDPDAQFVALTVAEDIAFALENDNRFVDELHQRVQQWAEILQMPDLLQQKPQELSGGQKQRVALAGVLIDDEPILLLDEPLANLDPAAGQGSMELLDRLAQERGLTVIVIDHRIEEALHVPFDRIVVLKDGQFIANDSPTHVLQSDVLLSNGLREPLYVTALKDAGVDVSGLDHLDKLADIILTPDDKSKLINWQQRLPRVQVKEDPVPLLNGNGLTFGYPGQRMIFENFNFSINAGEMVALVGQNGTGKTTLINLITGFLQPQSGHLTLGDRSLDSLSVKERAEKIGYVLQDPNQMISKTMVFDEVVLGLQLRGISQEEQEQRAKRILQVTGLYPFRNWPISALSFGQKKRVTIAAVLVLQPQVLILDEPTAGQDLAHYAKMMDFLRKMNRQLDVTVLMVTHDMNLMMSYADRTLVLDGGRLLANSKPAEVLTDPALVQQAHLSQLSLQKLADKVGIADAITFAEKFSAYERGKHDARRV
ncbi:ABC transporter ATP-binding protein [Ligilactobacillus pobuzihii]|uniref:ABC transporter, ATP-binding protein n=1 Tax=Ligilactobacillus pobuzihii TaxID=449659 RepID=A0A0R2L6T7_9LACO|nr:ABC transporter ATP-binding protein [Ligilactobacillus pobuzihii]KRK09958.1 ABC transporter, ATP-binding protein [Ligilactobacillus pobuzihii E100301 = KCTC 13174]KRN95621.1 ABC transporter, ATP-binding protein [Ligilactobacillus pobuzihii]GEN47961.1 putative ABC transporter ATP-binding protein [Ligilactobacillus pobuzihii]